MANRSPSHYPDIGVLGEELVAQWLCSKGWVIRHRRWRCRWGEIDIIATKAAELVFVEVKTRSRGNWDAGGLLSITAPKQAKLRQTARCFLATYPHLAEQPCRFDVALVCCQRLSTRQRQGQSGAPITVATSASESSLLPVQVGRAAVMEGFHLILQDYIPSAFEGGG